MALILRKEPPVAHVVDLGDGASIRLFDPLAWHVETANAAAERVLRDIRAGRLAADLYGLSGVADIDETIDEDVLAGFFTTIYVTELALVCAEGWEGIVDGEGAAAPLNRENLAALMLDSRLFIRIRDRLMRPLALYQREKKTSASLSNGGSPAASTTVAPVAMSAPPAPVADA